MLIYFLLLEPGPPQNFRVASSTSNSARFTWTQPRLTNGVVTHYDLLCISDDSKFADIRKGVNVPFYKFNHRQFTTITHVSKATTYQCQLCAFNEVGEGPAATITLDIRRSNGVVCGPGFNTEVQASISILVYIISMYVL